jgi:glycosyltransferase involved in cell wall biosynthesis
MKIGISTSVIQKGKTGISRYVIALIREFIQFDSNNTFVLFVLEKDFEIFKFAEKHLRIIKVSEKFRPPLLNIIWHQFWLPRLIKKHDVDVMHIPSYRRLLWFKPCAMVGTIHDLAQFNVPRKYSLLRMIYGRKIVPHLAQRQDEIIAISKCTACDVRDKFGVAPERLTTIYNGLDKNKSDLPIKEISKDFIKHKYNIEGAYLLYVSRLEYPAKNHIQLIHAFEKFKHKTNSSWKLVFAGSDWHGAGKIHAAIARSIYVNEIYALGFVDDIDLTSLYSGAEVFVYPSSFEGFGLPPLEAMACGCPVLSSSRGSLPEILGKYALYVDPDDIDDFAKKLMFLFNNKNYSEHMIEQGLLHIQKFSWKKCAEQTLSVYSRAFNRKSLEERREFVQLRTAVSCNLQR